MSEVTKNPQTPPKTGGPPPHTGPRIGGARDFVSQRPPADPAIQTTSKPKNAGQNTTATMSTTKASHVGGTCKIARRLDSRQDELGTDHLLTQTGGRFFSRTDQPDHSAVWLRSRDGLSFCHGTLGGGATVLRPQVVVRIALPESTDSSLDQEHEQHLRWPMYTFLLNHKETSKGRRKTWGLSTTARGKRARDNAIDDHAQKYHDRRETLLDDRRVVRLSTYNMVRLPSPTHRPAAAHKMLLDHRVSKAKANRRSGKRGCNPSLDCCCRA